MVLVLVLVDIPLVNYLMGGAGIEMETTQDFKLEVYILEEDGMEALLQPSKSQTTKE